MIDLRDPKAVAIIQQNLRTLPISDKANMAVMEKLCEWFDLYETAPHLLPIHQGKRQVLATIKTLLDCTPEQIVAVANLKEQ